MSGSPSSRLSPCSSGGCKFPDGTTSSSPAYPLPEAYAPLNGGLVRSSPRTLETAVNAAARMVITLPRATKLQALAIPSERKSQNDCQTLLMCPQSQPTLPSSLPRYPIIVSNPPSARLTFALQVTPAPNSFLACLLLCSTDNSHSFAHNLPHCHGCCLNQQNMMIVVLTFQQCSTSPRGFFSVQSLKSSCRPSQTRKRTRWKFPLPRPPLRPSGANS